MPEMDGIEATRLLKERSPRIGVVALSGHEDQGDRARDARRRRLRLRAEGLRRRRHPPRRHARRRAAGPCSRPEVTPTRDRRAHRSARPRAPSHAASSRRRRRPSSSGRHDATTSSPACRTSSARPVTVILGVAQTLARGNLAEAQRKDLLERLVARAQDLARLVERFEVTVDAGAHRAGRRRRGRPRPSPTTTPRIERRGRRTDPAGAREPQPSPAACWRSSWTTPSASRRTAPPSRSASRSARASSRFG